MHRPLVVVVMTRVRRLAHPQRDEDSISARRDLQHGRFEAALTLLVELIQDGGAGRARVGCVLVAAPPNVVVEQSAESFQIEWLQRVTQPAPAASISGFVWL